MNNKSLQIQLKSMMKNNTNNETESAIDSYEKSIAIKKRVLSPYHESIAILLTNLA